MAMLALTRRKIFWVLVTLSLGGLYGAWAMLTARSGNQRVAFVPADERCGASEQLKYCIYRAAEGTNGDVVYHLHGRNLDEHTWNDDTYWTSMIQAEWQRTRVRPPTIVSLSYGPTWLLAPRGERSDSGLLDDLIARLPEIETKAGGARRRMLVGESMGGLNVLIAGLTHTATFAKVAALCPGVYAVSPFAPYRTLKEALKRTGADPKIGFGIWLLARRYVANEQEWRRISPLVLANQARPPYPALYLSNGLYDAYGNFEGTQRLADLAGRRGMTVEWHPLYGGHCAIDTPSLARFLVS